jgi:hypothetical protein
MGMEERMRLVRMIEKMSEEPEYCKRLGIVNVSRIKTGNGNRAGGSKQIRS